MKKYIGDRAFYKRLFAVMIPILIQNVITNFVSLLDNIMVGQVGTEPMSGVAIVNRLLFVYNLAIFGGLAGASIYTAQFYGKGDDEGVRNTVRFKWFVALGIFAAGLTVLLTMGDTLIGLFIHDGGEALDLAATSAYAKDYLLVMLFQLFPFAVSNIYASTLRETGETVLPMKAGIAAVMVNMVFNYILIFGKLGAPKLGVVGAAIATVLSRFVECGILVIWTHRHKERNRFVRGLYSTFRVPGTLAKQIAVMGFPLLINEVLWSSGMTTLDQCYSMRGLEVISALNISTTVSNLFFCAFFSMGNTISIMVGQILGSGDTERAVDEDRKLIAFAVALCTVVGLFMVVLAPLIPGIYKTTDGVKALAATLLTICAVMMPVNAFTNGCYFTLRSGGKTWITFAFDSLFVWVVAVPAAVFISRRTAMAIVPMYIVIQALDLIKCVVGYILVKSRKWVNNLVKE